eukprot:7039176-Prymnesium_polylepis.1
MRPRDGRRRALECLRRPDVCVGGREVGRLHAELEQSATVRARAGGAAVRAAGGLWPLGAGRRLIAGVQDKAADVAEAAEVVEAARGAGWFGGGGGG